MPRQPSDSRFGPIFRLLLSCSPRSSRPSQQHTLSLDRLLLSAKQRREHPGHQEPLECEMNSDHETMPAEQASSKHGTASSRSHFEQRKLIPSGLHLFRQCNLDEGAGAGSYSTPCPSAARLRAAFGDHRRRPSRGQVERSLRAPAPDNLEMGSLQHHLHPTPCRPPLVLQDGCRDSSQIRAAERVQLKCDFWVRHRDQDHGLKS
mmetsp:Transcript_53720/g.125585  ORF Transcript_53720/g.125585 Transcript_53720/m.125585 type:complete len:205 (-) Transcript_53720:137-751(-)